MNDTHDNTCINADLTAQSCIDDIYFRCSQAKSLANVLANLPKPLADTHSLTGALIELLEDSIENLSALQRFVGGEYSE